MPSISEINEQLIIVEKAIGKVLTYMVGLDPRIVPIVKYSSTLADLCKAQESLVRTQAMIFVECTESGLDMPVLPLFCEERDSEEEEDGEEEK